MLCSDGWSWAALKAELAAAYNAIRAGRASPDLPELAVQYVDFSAWQRARLEGDALEAQRQYWRQQLAGAPLLLELPTDAARPSVPTGRGASVDIELPASLVKGLTELASSSGATLFMALLAAWQVCCMAMQPCLDVLLWPERTDDNLGARLG